MIGALFTGITGLSSQQKALDNESNNIANVNTVGFKASRISFADQMYQDRIGKGSKILDAEKLYTQGSLKITGVAYDMALNGEGFFTVKDNNTNENMYTRAGNFRMGDNGTLQDAAGNEVQGWMMTAIDNEKDVISSNPNVNVFTNDYSKMLSSKIIKHNTYVETITAKATDYNATATSDSETIFSGAGLKTKSAKISDIEEAIKDYTTWLQRLSEEPDGASATSIAQISEINFKTGKDGLVTKEGDQVYAFINGTKYSQNYLPVTADDDFIASMLKTDSQGNLIDSSKLSNGGTSGNVVDLSITAEDNTRYSLTINGTEVHYDSDTDATISEISEGLKAAIVAQSDKIGLTDSEVTLTSTDNTQAIASSTTTAAASGTAQIDTVTISGTIEQGDKFKVTFGGTDYTYTATLGDDADDVATGLAALINGKSDGTTTLTAAAAGSGGQLTLTSDKTDGTTFSISESTANASNLVFDLDNASGTTFTFQTNKSTIEESYDVAASRIETYKALADKISEIPGLQAYMVKENDGTNIQLDAFDEDDTYSLSTYNKDMYYGQIQIKSLIPGQEFIISEVAEVSGSSVIQGNYQTSTAAQAGSGVGALNSSKEALAKLVTGNQRDVYTVDDLKLKDDGSTTQTFTYGMTIYDKEVGSNIPVPNDAQVPYDQYFLKFNAKSIDEVVDAINTGTGITLVDSQGNTVTGNNNITDYIKAQNINGSLVVSTKDDNYDVEFSGVMKYANSGVNTPIDVNNNYSGRAGAGAEFIEIINKVDQTASKGSLQLRLDTLGISDSAFGEFSVDSAGLITMKQDGADFAIGQVAIAVFNNNRGLEPMGDNLLGKTTQSGEAYYNLNNDKTASIAGKTLELSSADLSESLVNLMVFQRAFEANAKSITTSDELLNTLINLKR